MERTQKGKIPHLEKLEQVSASGFLHMDGATRRNLELTRTCLLYTSDAADERSSVDLGGRRIIKKKKT